MQQYAAWRATYTPGSWVVMAGPSSLVVMPPAPADASGMVNTMWETIVDSASAGELMQRLAAFGTDNVPDFAAFFWAGEAMHSVVRGSLEIKDAASGERVNHGAGVISWREASIESRHVRIEMEPVADSGLHLPLMVGAVQASSIELDATGTTRATFPAARAEGQGGASVAAAPGALGTPAPVQGAGDDAAGEHASLQDAQPMQPAHDHEYDALPATQLDMERPIVGAEQHADAPAAEAAEFVDAPHPAPEASGYQPEVGAAPEAGFPVPAPAESADGAQEEQQAPHQPAFGQSAAPMPSAEPMPSASEPHGQSPQQYGQPPMGEQQFAQPQFGQPQFGQQEYGQPQFGQPQFGQSAAPMPSASEPYGQAPQQFGQQEFGQPQFGQSQFGQQSYGQQQYGQPQFGQPQFGQQSYGQPQFGQSAAPMPSASEPYGQATSRHVLRASTGESVDLDAPVVVGRAPSAEGHAPNTRTMRVPSPSLDISRNHLLVEPRDGRVEVVDNSTNGTIVRLMSGESIRLSQGERVAVDLGAIIDLGDGVTLEVTNN